MRRIGCNDRHRIASNDNVAGEYKIRPYATPCDALHPMIVIAGEYKIRPYAYRTSMPASSSSAAIPASQSS
jgi:hypothetical protein